MRIRKNAKVSPLKFCSHASAADLQPHVCQLNQDPWDAFTFGPESNQQWKDENSSYRGSFGVGAVERIASLRDSDKKKPSEMREEPIGEKGDENEEERSDRRGCKCKIQAKQGQYDIASKKSPAAASGVVQLVDGGRHPRKKSKMESASETYEYIYYSGFDPWWAPKRPGSKEMESRGKGGIASTANTNSSTIPPSHESTLGLPLSQIGNEEFNYVLFDDDEDDELAAGLAGGESRRKRKRKPVKERSLKSLM